MSDSMFGELLLAAVMLVCGFAVIDLWRKGEKWLAIMLSAACWAVLLIVIAAHLAP